MSKTPDELVSAHPAGAISDDDAFHLVQSGNSRGATLGTIRGLVGSYATRAAVALASVNPGASYIRTRGYSTVGDGGGALYSRVASEPSHAFKVQSGDGAWWEGVVPPEGVNVRQLGAVGDGTTDDSTAIANAWAYAIGNPTQTGKGAILYFPAGDYLIRSNNVFGVPGHTGQFFWPTIRGAGRGATVLRFRPATGDNAFSDNVYALFDGGDGSTNAAADILRTIITDLLIYLEDDDLTTGDEIWVWRQDGTGAQQNFRMTDVEVRGPGSMTAGNLRSGVLDIVGAINGSENYFTTCNFLNLSHIMRNANPQAVDNAFIECDVWLIHDHFFVVENGAISVRVWGGSWIWADTPDVNPQYLFHVDSSGGVNPGVGNMTANVIGMKSEMRNAGAALVSSEDAGGAVMINFHSCNFAGGSISGDRDVVVLERNKAVTFDKCIIPHEFGFNFTVPNSQIGSLQFACKNTGLVSMRDCAITDAISERITQTGAGGRVIAEGCYELTGTVAAVAAPVDFDSNPFSGGPNETPAKVKIASGFPSAQTWSSGETYTFLLPYGARLLRCVAHRPASGGATSRTMTLADGNGALATDTANEDAGLNIDHTPAYAAGRGLSRTTTNQRTLTLTAGTLTAGVSGAEWHLEYI